MKGVYHFTKNVIHESSNFLQHHQKSPAVVSYYYENDSKLNLMQKTNMEENFLKCIILRLRVIQKFRKTQKTLQSPLYLEANNSSKFIRSKA